MMYKHLCDILTLLPSVGKRGDTGWWQGWLDSSTNSASGSITGSLSNHAFSIPCHCGLVERANHREKHILLISPSHCWFSQESLPSRPHANLLIWLSMVALTVSCDFLAVTDTLGDPRPEVCHPAPRAFMVPVLAYHLISVFPKCFALALCYSSVIVRCRRRGLW